MKMITRFSLYGFLKNLDFSEPFLILFYLSIGLNFFQIGVLVSFLNICINIMEVPSGALADIYGRKNCMILSLTSYIFSFAIFAFSESYIPLFPAVFFFSIGEAFRTGTHKAMIFDWLRKNDRLGEKTKVYGFTRSWSKYGSAISVVIATIIIIFSKSYRWIFIFSIIPYIAGVWNIACYPDYLNKKLSDRISIKLIFTHTFESLRTVFASSNLRKLIVQSMGFEGVFEVTKDYLQPILKAQAVVLAAFLMLPEKESTAVTVGIIYFILHIISANASLRSHIFAARFRSEQTAIIAMIFFGFALAFVSSAGLYLKLYAVAIIAYIAYYVIQNLWRPILVAQYDDYAESSQQASILSIESQTKTVGITIIAPVAGFMADRWGIESSLMLLAILLLILWVYSVAGRKEKTPASL
ncbi:MAG: MFS transporter [Spirochaetae bacterium HGW-Spirochaetae-1]|jgi:MFS family permease|nr:MAG: MFS transporter [Spirochaetae bacterium HGW-Spirochaetae-1]